jgi:hypothetical protein
MCHRGKAFVARNFHASAPPSAEMTGTQVTFQVCGASAGFGVETNFACDFGLRE